MTAGYTPLLDTRSAGLEVDETDDGFRPSQIELWVQCSCAGPFPTIRDRAVMMAAVLVLDPIFEADLATRTVCLSAWPQRTGRSETRP